MNEDEKILEQRIKDQSEIDHLFARTYSFLRKKGGNNHDLNEIIKELKLELITLTKGKLNPDLTEARMLVNLLSTLKHGKPIYVLHNKSHYISADMTLDEPNFENYKNLDYELNKNQKEEWKCPGLSRWPTLKHGMRHDDYSHEWNDCHGKLCVDCCARTYGNDNCDYGMYGENLFNQEDLVLNESQLQRVAENNDMNNQFLNQGFFRSQVELKQKLKDLGIKDPEIQVNRMLENAWTSIVLNKCIWVATDKTREEN